MVQDKRDNSPNFRLVVAADKGLDSQAGHAKPLMPGVGTEFKLLAERVLIGRRPYSDVVLDHVTVSGEHAVLQKVGQEYELVDTGSSNGSFVNGSRVIRKRLRAGDYLGIGVFQLQLIADALSASALQPDLSAPHLSSALAASKVAQIEYLSGPLKGIKQLVNRSILKIGRGAEVAVIGRRREGYFLTHLEGLKPSLLNGEAVTVGSRSLRDGDLIQLGEVQIRFNEVELSDALG
jgi:predicted component of type VI protein secretion system